MDKMQLIQKGKKAVSAFFRVRRGIKIFFACGTGISTGIYSFKVLYELTGHGLISLYYAILAGAATIVYALIFMEVMRRLIALLKKPGLKLYKKAVPEKENK